MMSVANSWESLSSLLTFWLRQEIKILEVLQSDLSKDSIDSL